MNYRSLVCSTLIVTSLGILSACGSASDSAEASSSPTVAAKAPEVQGCLIISDAIADMVTKLGGAGDTYTVDDVTASLNTQAPKLQTWAQINKDGGAIKAASWLESLSTNAKRLRVALVNVDSTEVTKYAGLLSADTKRETVFCKAN